MDPNGFRVALRAIFAAIVTEIPDQFFFLGVDRDYRLLFGQRRSHLGVDVAELRIPVGVVVALLGLAVGLQAVARRISSSATRVRLTWWPCACSACASRRTLLQVHRNGDSGSPRVVGSTNASRSGSSVGSLQIAGFPPAPAPPIRSDRSSSSHSLPPP